MTTLSVEDQLVELRDRITQAKEDLVALERMRDDLILTGKEGGFPVSYLGTLAGMRRESAHYAALRAAARRAAESEVNGE